MSRQVKRHTIEKNFLFHLYFSEDRYFVDYYNSPIIHSYATETAAREAIYYHIN